MFSPLSTDFPAAMLTKTVPATRLPYKPGAHLKQTLIKNSELLMDKWWRKCGLAKREQCRFLYVKRLIPLVIVWRPPPKPKSYKVPERSKSLFQVGTRSVPFTHCWRDYAITNPRGSALAEGSTWFHSRNITKTAVQEFVVRQVIEPGRCLSPCHH
jgi:hypothetical protein